MINVTEKSKDEIEIISMYERLHGFISQIKMLIEEIKTVGEEIQDHKFYKDTIIGASVQQDEKIKAMIAWAESIDIDPNLEDKTKSQVTIITKP